MILLKIVGAVAVHVLAGILFYWMRVHRLGSVVRWDAVVFGVPLVAGAVAYFLVLRTGRMAGGNASSGNMPVMALVAVVLAVLVQAIAMTIAVNMYGS